MSNSTLDKGIDPCCCSDDERLVRFKIRGWGETGLHVGSAYCLGGSIGTLVSGDADVARQPAEVNVEV